MAVIEVDHLTKRFTGLTAVDDVTFAVEQASVVGFLGPNGAGNPVTELRHSLRSKLDSRVLAAASG